jgi:SAM-dependent methyltransferase
MAQNLTRNGDANKLSPEDRAVHDWYRFVLSFPPHLVREYLHRFELDGSHLVLDPFCGTGTTLVESKKLGVPSIGIEANQLAYFACQVKTHWEIDPDELLVQSYQIADDALNQLKSDGVMDDPLFLELQSEDRFMGAQLRKLDQKVAKLLLADSVSPVPMHKVIVLRECLERHRGSPYHGHQLLALAHALVYSISNLRFGPEVGLGRKKIDTPVVSAWLARVQQMAQDLRQLQGSETVGSIVHHRDSREMVDFIAPGSIDAVFTSPPYPNEKDYTRTTRLESVLLGFIDSKEELQALKRNLLRSNTRGVYKGDDDYLWVEKVPEVQRIAEMIEARRLELGKTSGFERLYPTVTKLYFGGMARHLANLRQILKPGAQLGYVVGDQASYLRVMIRTGKILAVIAESLGYEVTGIDLFRTRLATATKDQLREEVLLLRWRG